MKKFKICLVILYLLSFLTVGTLQLYEANFFMREIIVNSKKHGVRSILIDNEDYKDVSRYRWSIHSPGINKFYAVRKVNKKIIKMNRYLLNITDPNIKCDHRDGNGLNNQRDNIRKCFQIQNTKNATMHIDNKSGFKGVIWVASKSKFRAGIMSNGHSFFLGYYNTAIEAALAYNEAATKYHGEFAQLNIIAT